MKAFLTILLIFCSLFAYSQDTICMPVERAARIADTLAYLRQFQQYGTTCDSALASCKQWGNDIYRQNILLTQQRDGVASSAALLAEQLGKQKSISQQWEAKAMELDKKIQKQKKTRNALFGIFGTIITGLGTGLILSRIL